MATAALAVSGDRIIVAGSDGFPNWDADTNFLVARFFAQQVVLDLTPPTAELLSAPTLRAEGTNNYTFTVRFTDDTAVKAGTVIPATLVIIFLLLFFNFRTIAEPLIVMLSVPFALVGGVWFVWAFGYALSVAVAIGFIALAGVAAETGVVMLVYLDHAWKKRVDAGVEPTTRDLYEAVMEGAVERVRPKMMTVLAIMAGLLPILWGSGPGASVMQRIAAPMVGGMISSTVLTLVVIPAVYSLWKERSLGRVLAPGPTGDTIEFPVSRKTV